MKKLLLAVVICLMTFSQNAVAQDMIIDSSGNIGIGEPNPTSKLDVYTTTGDAIVGTSTSGWAGYFEGDTNVTGNLTVESNTNVTGSLTVGGAIINSGIGDVTGVTAGTGLTGGGTANDVTLNINYAGTGAANTASRSDHNHDTIYYDKSYVDALEARIAALESLLVHFSVSGNNVIIEGANLHVRNSGGSTDGAVDGLGNIIVGYDEARTIGNNKAGSHNIIVGKFNNYSSYGGLVIGNTNEISGPYATVSGGKSNRASGISSFVAGGYSNEAFGDYSAILGGHSNVSGDQALSNHSIGLHSTISGGFTNNTMGDKSSVSGGIQNSADGQHASVSGGKSNTASGESASVSGGFTNTASFFYSSVSGGEFNESSGSSASVSGGTLNKAIQTSSSVTGGESNTAGSTDPAHPDKGVSSVVTGGQGNTSLGDISVVSGGRNRTTTWGGIYDWRAGDFFDTE